MNEPLAYCWQCRGNQSMKWKPLGQRGKGALSWFVCAKCGGSNIELKMLPYFDAVKINKNRRYKKCKQNK